MKALKLILFLILMLYLSIVEADFYTGNDLKSKIDDSNVYVSGAGFGYILGVADSIDGYGYCPPSGESGIRAGQLKEVVMKYFREHPEKLHLSASSLVTAALMRTWPCAKKAPAPPRPSKPKPKPEETNPF